MNVVLRKWDSSLHQKHVNARLLWTRCSCAAVGGSRRDGGSGWAWAKRASAAGTLKGPPWWQVQTWGRPTQVAHRTSVRVCVRPTIDGKAHLYLLTGTPPLLPEGPRPGKELWVRNLAWSFPPSLWLQSHVLTVQAEHRPKAWFAALWRRPRYAKGVPSLWRAEQASSCQWIFEMFSTVAEHSGILN